MKPGDGIEVEVEKIGIIAQHDTKGSALPFAID
jgi:hypothetical protein